MKKFILLLVFATALIFSGCEKVVVDQRTEYQTVDLGLSVKWAKINVGAVSITDCGDYFAWGEVTTKTDYSDKNYKWMKDGELTKYCGDETCGNPDNLTELLNEDDAAVMLWGDGWRMPTYKEVMELVKNCTWTWSFIDGVRGYKVTSKIPGYEDKYIFLPAAGMHTQGSKPEIGYEARYWSSTNCGGRNSGQSQALNFDYTSVKNDGYTDGITRTLGATIRPVHK